jgi:hypothetical protein
MKSKRCLCSILAANYLLAQLTTVASGIGGVFSEAIWLDRYTVNIDGSLTHDTGHLLGKGVFQVVAKHKLATIIIITKRAYAKAFTFCCLYGGRNLHGLRH